MTPAFQWWTVATYSTETRSSHATNILPQTIEPDIFILGSRGKYLWTWELSALAEGGLVALSGLTVSDERDSILSEVPASSIALSRANAGTGVIEYSTSSGKSRCTIAGPRDSTSHRRLFEFSSSKVCEVTMTVASEEARLEPGGMCLVQSCYGTVGTQKRSEHN